MSKPKVIILGSTGMLGSIILDYFVKSEEFDVVATYRDNKEAGNFIKNYPNVEFRQLDAENYDQEEISETIKGVDWIINAIGIIKPYIHDDNAFEVERATRVNSLFPHILGKAADLNGIKVIQIATDCVYSGRKGKYVEVDLHDAIDVYGKSKSLGEAYLSNVYHLRCSIIGPELKAHLSLMDWFLSQAKDSELNGFTNHKWNGVTTLQYARICQGIIKENIAFDHIQHIIPGNVINKANLLKCFGREFERTDIIVNEIEATSVIDRTLQTNNKELNEKIWQAAGYNTPPTIEHMVAEVAEYGFPGSITL